MGSSRGTNDNSKESNSRIASRVTLVAGFQKNSFVDFPAKIASVIFLGGCNFNCYYCHNRSILSHDSNVQPFDDVLAQIRDQLGFIDGVVLTGGEPTCHPHLPQIAQAIKDLSPTTPLLVKLDTNGTNPELLKTLVESGMVDYVAMDVKSMFEKYPQIAGVMSDITPIKTSIDYLIRQTKVDYMFRTTLAPILTPTDVLEIGKLLDGAKCLQLQQFNPTEYTNAQKIVHLPHTKTTAEKLAKSIEKHVQNVILRGFS